MKKFNKFWKAVLIIFMVSTTSLTIYLGWKFYDFRFGAFKEDFPFNSKFAEKYYHDGKYQLIDINSGRSTTPKLDWIASPGKNGTLTVFSLNRKRGYLNANTGRIAIPAKYEHAWAFSEDVGAVVMNGRVGFIDGSEHLVIPYKFIYSGKKDKDIDFVFSGGYCAAMDSTEKLGLINKRGEWVIPPRYDYINNPVIGYRIVKLARKYGLLDNKLKLILPIEYDHIEIQKDGLKIAKNGEQQLVTFDTKTILKPFVYDDIVNIQFGSGRMDSTGTEVSTNTNCFAYRIFTKWGLIRRDGKVVTKAVYDEIDGLSDRLFSCTIENYKFTVNSEGNTAH